MTGGRHRIYFVLLVLASSSSLARTDEEATYPAVYLQSKGIPSADSYLQLKKDIGSFSSVTVCLHLLLYHTRSSLVPVASYAVPEFPEELTIYIDWVKGGLSIMCCGGNGRIDKAGVISFSILRSWLHMCLSLDVRSRRYALALDSELYEGEIESLSGQDLTVRGGGALILGQEQDTFRGGFHVQQTFQGYLANFRIVPEFVNEAQMGEYVACGPEASSEGHFALLSENWETFGDVEFVSVPVSEVCGQPKAIRAFFPELRTLEEAIMLCNNVKGTIVAPQDHEENREVVSKTQEYVAHCTGSEGAFLWLGFRANLSVSSRTFYNLNDNETVAYTNFRQGYSLGMKSSQCVFMDSFEVGMWAVHSCNLKACTMCSFTSHSILRLRGLCDDTILDFKYIIDGMRNGKPLLKGVKHTDIYWNGTSWVIMDQLNAGIEGYMEMTDLLQYPFGLRFWKIRGDMCPKSRLQLLLTACRADQYSCDDGTCIRKMQRCNLEVNCPDQSDEKSCNAVVVPEEYIKEMPPARRGTEPARVHVKPVILSMQPIDTLNMKMTLVLRVELLWRDPRLHMESLNYVDTWNVIYNQERIWRPSLLFQDVTGTQAETTLQWETFTAVMESGPEPDDITRVKEDEVYPGKTNSLKLTQTFYLHVSCQMDLVPYPFDIQTCKVKMRLLYFSKDLVALTSLGKSVSYLGAKTLREYEMVLVEMKPSDWKNHSGQEIIFHLNNLSGFYISSTFIPTFLMVLISYSTFYFEMEDFNDRIMVSLTALLVLATLFTQITETTPKTSFLKLLDIWFVSCILFDFLIIIILVTINVQRVREIDNQVTPFNKKKKRLFPAKNRSQQINTLAKVVIPIVLFALVMVYVGVTYK